MNRWKTAFLERLFSHNRPELLAFLRRRVGIQTDAADLAQEVFLRLLRARNLEEIRNPQAYLYTVAANLIRERAQAERRWVGRMDLESCEAQEQLAEQPLWDEQIDQRRRVVELRRLMARLPERWRTALLLQYQHGMTYKDIARQLGVSPSMVKKYLVKGLTRIRRDLAEPG